MEFLLPAAETHAQHHTTSDLHGDSGAAASTTAPTCITGFTPQAPAKTFKTTSLLKTSDDLSRNPTHAALNPTPSMVVPSDYMDEASLSDDSDDFDMDQACEDLASSEGSVDVDTDMIAWLAESGIVGAI